MNIEFESDFSVVLVEEVLPDGRSAWTALHPELPGCNAVGFSQSEALNNLSQSRQAWLDVASKIGLPVPAPMGEQLVTTMYSPARGANVVTQTGQESETEVKQLAAA